MTDTTTGQGGAGAVTAVLVIVVIGVVAWIAYHQGLFRSGGDNKPGVSIKVEMPETSKGY